jgi:hypothetical protein
MFDQDVTQLPGVLLGTVTGVDERGLPIVSTGAAEAPAAYVVWMPDPPEWSDCVGLRVVLALVDGDESRPVVLGLLDAPPAPPKQVPDALRVESRRELVIECGKSKIALRADGRIEIRGGHLISRSSGPNKIKGGTVHIN